MGDTPLTVMTTRAPSVLKMKTKMSKQKKVGSSIFLDRHN